MSHRRGVAVAVMPAMVAQLGTWTEYTDDERNAYFYNSVTGESVWELPDGVVAKKGEDDAGKSTATATGASPDPCTESSPLSAEDSSHHWLGALDEAYSLVEVAKKEDEASNMAAAIKAYGVAGDAFLNILASIPDAKGTGKYSLIEAQVEATIKRGRDLKKEEAALQDRADTEKKKRPVVQELVKTEETYNANIRALRQHYMLPLHENLMSLSPVMTEGDLATIFQNADDILRHSDALLQELRDNAVSERLLVGPVLQRNMRHVGIYRQYVTNLDQGTRRLLELQREKPEFEDFVKNIASDHASGSRTRGDVEELKPIDFYLIEPFQRVLRYKMLIERVLTCTDVKSDKAEFDCLQDALSSVGSVATAMNEAKREAEQMENLRRIQALLAAQGVVCGGKCLKQGLVRLVKSGARSGSFGSSSCSPERGFWGLGGNGQGKGDGDERWMYMFDDGLVCSEGARSASEQAGFFSGERGSKGEVRWGHMTNVREADGEEASHELVVEYADGTAELLRGTTGAAAREWVTELRRTRLRVAVSEQVDAGRSLEQVFKDFDRDNDGGLDRTEMHAALRSIGLELKDGDVSTLMLTMDKDGDGMVNYTEFCKGVEQYTGLRKRKVKRADQPAAKAGPQWGRMVAVPKPSPPKTPKPPITLAAKVVRVGGCLFCICTCCGFLGLVLVFMLIFFIFEPIFNGFHDAFGAAPA